MDDKLTFKICLSLSLFGILILFIYTENLKIEIKDMASINKDDLNKITKVVGQIINIKDLPGIIILNLKDKTGIMSVIIFKEEKLNIKKNDFLEVEGIVKEYKEKFEIQAEKIIKK